MFAKFHLYYQIMNYLILSHFKFIIIIKAFKNYINSQNFNFYLYWKNKNLLFYYYLLPSFYLQFINNFPFLRDLVKLSVLLLTLLFFFFLNFYLKYLFWVLQTINIKNVFKYNIINFFFIKLLFILSPKKLIGFNL